MVSENESEFMERGCSVVCGGGVPELENQNKKDRKGYAGNIWIISLLGAAAGTGAGGRALFL